MNRFLLLLALCFSQSLIAQKRFDFLVGATFSSFNTDLISEYGFDTFREEYINAGGSVTSEVKNALRPGFYIAVEGDFYLGEKTFLKTGLKYMTAGDSYYFKTDDVVLQSSSGSETDERFKLRPKLEYLSVPVNFGLDIGDKFSVYAGLTPSLTLNNVLRNNRFEGSGDDVKQKWDGSDNPVDEASIVTFVNAGVTYIFMGDSNPLLILDLRVNHSLNSVYNDSDFDNSAFDFNDTKLWSVELGIGLALNSAGSK
ncbi:MAG: outer membrane beta-barrel protein [Cyclobacteriaceae bacterium]|nr:outer membrane beta-barrel protein [Cyclobacteriaceae bacterium HetDA_MAG_MS6]